MLTNKLVSRTAVRSARNARPKTTQTRGLKLVVAKKAFPKIIRATYSTEKSVNVYFDEAGGLGGKAATHHEAVSHHAENPAAERTASEYFRIAGFFLGVTMPVALFLHPSPIAIGVDLMNAGVIAYHGYMGMKHVIHDYVPHDIHFELEVVVLVVSLLLLAGLARLTLEGDGVSGTLKQVVFQSEGPSHHKDGATKNVY